MKYNLKILFFIFFMGFVLVGNKHVVLANSGVTGIDVSDWDTFGNSKQDYSQSTFFANQIMGTNKIDLRRDLIYLGYRGNNLSKDIFINGSRFDITQEQQLQVSDILTIKNIGLLNGNHIEARIKILNDPILLNINAKSEGFDSLLTMRSRHLNTLGLDYHVRIDFYFTNNNQKVSNLGNKYFFMPTTVVNGWDIYLHALLINKNTNVLIGNKERDIPAWEGSRLTVSNNKYKIGIGGAFQDYTPYYYNFLFNDSGFDLGVQGIDQLSSVDFGLFDPLDQVNSMPKPYDNISFTSSATEEGDIQNTVLFNLPRQDDDLFFPENIDFNLRTEEQHENTIRVPTVSVDNNVISSNEYSFTREGKVIFPKLFLKKYQDKTIKIQNIIDIDYSSDQTLDRYYNSAQKEFLLPSSLDVLCYYDTFSESIFKQDTLTTFNFPLSLKGTDLHAEIEIGRTSKDYPKEDFISTLTSNFPNDTVSVTIPKFTFDKFEEKTVIPITLTSQKLDISQTIHLETKVFKNLPIKYIFKTDDASSKIPNNDLPTKTKQFYNTPVDFKLPWLYDTYKLSSVEPRELSITTINEDTNRISGIVDNNLKEITVYYKLNKVNVTIEFLLDGLDGYETHSPVKEGINLEDNKKTITIQGIIGQSLSDFINENKSHIFPTIKYYDSNIIHNLEASYWHLSNSMVGENNPSRPVKSSDIIPNKPITVSSLYKGMVSLSKIDSFNFGNNKNTLNVKEIFPIEDINYEFIDTTKKKGNTLQLTIDSPFSNKSGETLKAYSFMFDNEVISNQSIEILKSNEENTNMYRGNLKDHFSFKRMQSGLENTGDFSGTLHWTIMNAP